MRMMTSRKANAHILYDAQTAPQTGRPALEPEHFTAGWWRSHEAVTGQAPGRGESLFVCAGEQAWVLRQYRRGGAIARLSAEHYVWTGLERNRAFRECRLLATLFERGLPVPQPIGACAWRDGLFYRAALITRHIDGARALATRVSSPDAAACHEPLLIECGRMIRRFHAEGLDHVDLNARNILIDARDTPWLIDLDRCRLRAPGRWQADNLARLERSLEKFAPGQARALMAPINHGYQSS
ncbi:3-deoxy-D-manno-octulosonic acid kinase [Kushneria avicenniae]|uniref:3-deoxy-D-manno-octulosonic acid kinase n=1 Tax=Kushneria avicenniae TaxID=402385 RepID=A0A1I1JE31_9GAMM|nr:3-deoxy-D-manno-octulosonic acid kinase [Kushneria avicenniae]SFC46706.1 3-deoxy-D-manno-octulosonic acid kinase [Kushneria avicenniae]